MRIIALLLALLCLGGPALAYIDMPAEKLTLPRLLLEFRSAGVYRIDRVDLQRGAAQYSLVQVVQGRCPQQTRHVLRLGESVPAKFRGLAAGRKVLLFSDDPYGRGLAFIEDAGWYISTWDRDTKWWLIGYTDGHYDFGCGFVGSLDELVEACSALLAGDEVTVRCRKAPKQPAAQWARFTLRRPHEKAVVDGPATRPVNAATKPLSDAGIADLCATLQSSGDPFARRAAAVELGRRGAAAQEALPGLLAQVRMGYGAPETLVSTEAAAAIERIDPAGAIAVSLIVRQLASPEAKLRSRAARAASVLGPYAVGAAPALVRGVGDADSDVRYACIEALRYVEADPATAAAIIPRLADANRDVQSKARETLPRLGAGAADPLAKALSHSDRTIRLRAAEILGQIDPPPRKALGALKLAAQDEDPAIASAARAAIKRIERK